MRIWNAAHQNGKARPAVEGNGYEYHESQAGMAVYECVYWYVYTRTRVLERWLRKLSIQRSARVISVRDFYTYGIDFFIQLSLSSEMLRIRELG